jgi:hypothetical protein
MSEHLECPHCGRAGKIVGSCPAVLPKSVQCGGCRRPFPYIATALERVFSDVETDKDKPFYFRPFKGGHVVKEAEPVALTPEEQQEQWRQRNLKRWPTKSLIEFLHRSRRGWSSDDNYPINDWTTGLSYLASEVKAELALRPHIPNKGDARRARAKNAKNRRGGRADR